MTLPQIVIDMGFSGPSTGNVFTVGDPVLGRVGMVPIGADDVWVTVPPSSIRSWSIKRGAGQGDSPTLRYDPGTISIVFNDGDRRFDPENLLGPYVSAGQTQVLPEVRVRARLLWNGVSYPVFRGFADDFKPEYQGGFWTLSYVVATDATKVFAAFDRQPVTAAGEGEDSGARVNRILDQSGWPAADRVVSTGDTTLQATDLGGNQLSELQLVQDTELGDLYLDAQGRVVFRNRRALVTSTRSTTSQVTFGDGGFHAPLVSGFEAGVGGWTGNGGVLSWSSAQAHSGSFSALVTVSGSPASANIRTTSRWPVVAGHSYTLSFWIQASISSTAVNGVVNWFDASGAFLSSAGLPTSSITAGTWASVTGAGLVAPVGAAQATYGPTLGSSPPNGTLVYFDDVTLTDTDSEIPYADAGMSTPGDTLVNVINVARAGGTEQVVEDVVSKAKYLPKGHSRSDLLMQTDQIAYDWAGYLRYQYSTPARRFTRLDFNTPRPDVEGTYWPALLGLEFGDRITVALRPAGGGDPIVKDCFVRGVEFSQPDSATLTAALILQDASRYTFFKVGDPVLGRVGLNAVSY